MQSQPVTGELGPQQIVASDGPNGPPMQQFTCTVCDNKHFDVKHYFYGVDSIRCMWCLKYNKKRPVVKTAETVDPKD
jgi:hypothetical protein